MQCKAIFPSKFVSDFAGQFTTFWPKNPFSLFLKILRKLVVHLDLMRIIFHLDHFC